MTRIHGFNPGNRWRSAPPALADAAPGGADQTVSTSKYQNKITYVDGYRFMSKREARRYEQLRDLQTAGLISGLRLQPRYPLHDRHGNRVGVYVADFEYLENGVLITDDVKGTRTSLYEWKKRHFQGEYGRPIRET